MEYNDEDLGVLRIAHNPFIKYKIPKNQVTRKRSLTTEQIRAIKSYSVPDNMTGVMIARDVFIMSFIMVGMNSVDMYYLGIPNKGRLEYDRRKTMNRRSDRAFISINVEPELLPYLERYIDSLGDRSFNFFVRYSTHKQFVHKVNAHLKKVGDELGIPDLTLYAARHSWATIAKYRGVSIEMISEALGHKSIKTTQTYLKGFGLKEQTEVNKGNLSYIKNSHSGK